MSVSTDKISARIEGVKEFLRLVFLAAIGAAIAAAATATNLISDPILQVGLATLVASLAKAYDKYQHKNPETDAKGVVPF